MDIVHAVIALALLQFFIFGGLVGRARVKYGIEAPAVTGDPIFERYYRVHYNTMEQLVILIPGMLLFGIYINATASAALGLLFIVGRIIYFRAYIADPAKRGLGFGLCMLPISILLLGGLGGAVWSAVNGA
jgi:glutathione S-transferase